MRAINHSVAAAVVGLASLLGMAAGAYGSVPPAMNYFTLEPACRVYDSRSGAPITSGTSVDIPIEGACGVPGDPTAVVAVAFNVTVLSATHSGELTIFQDGTSLPTTATIYFLAGQARSNNGVVTLSFTNPGAVTGQPVLDSPSGTVHFLLDIVGYFVNDNLPVAVNDTATVAEDAAATTIDVRANDTDSDGGFMSISSVQNPSTQGGTVLITNGGDDLTYEPAADYCNDPPGTSPDTFTYTLNGGSTATVSVTVTCANDAPTDIALDNTTVAEDQPTGTAVGTFTTVDPDTGDTHTYTLVAGAGDTDNASFQIVGDELQTNAVFDFETKSSYSIRVRTTDNGSGNLFFEEQFTITVTDGNDAPTDIALDDTTVDEGLPAGTAVGNFTTTDPNGGDTHTYTLVAGTGDTDNASFTIVGNQLQTAAIFDFETQSSYSIRVRTTDSGSGSLSFEKQFTITVVSVNEAPTDIALGNASVAENQASGTAVGNFSTTDPDAGDTHTYTLVAGTGDTDNGSFQIVGNQLRTNAVFDFETKSSYSVRVRSTDAGGLFFEEAFTIAVTNVNETPTDIALDNSSVNENQPSGTAVGNFSTTDPDAGDTFTYTLVAGAGSTDNASFQIVGNQLQTAAMFNFEVKNSYSIRVRSTDAGGLFVEEAFTISVLDVPEPPVAGDDAYDTIGNTRLEVRNVATADGPKVVVIGDVMDNDTDPDAGATLSVAPTSGTTTKGGSYAILADGTFTYEPEAGDAHGAGTEDTFDYTLSDGTLTDTGTVKIKTFERVWYVNNEAPAGGTGRSNDPFDTLVEAQTASAANDYIFVYFGDGTATGQDAGITLKNGQHLIGEHAGLSVPVTGTFNGASNPNVSLVSTAPGDRPLISNTGAGNNAVSATDVIPIEIVALSLSSVNANAIDWTTNVAFAGTGTLTIKDNVVTGAGIEGVDVNLAGTGATRLAFHDNNLTATGTALDVQETGAGALTITLFDDNVVSSTSGGTGISIASATFDGTPGGSFQTVSGGTTVIGASGNGVGGSGMTLSIAGDLAFTDLDIFADNGSGLTITGTGAVNTGAGTGTRVTVGAGVGIVEATGGPALSLGTMTADFQLTSLKSTNSASTGVSLTNVADGTTVSTISAGSGSSITNATGTDFSISGGNANVTYNGTITDDLGQLVSVASATGDTISFTGAITDGDDGDGGGISLSSNGSTTIRFSGGLVLDTGATPAFAATGGGTVEVCDENPCSPGTTGSTINKIETTTATALNVANTNIGANHLEFRSISSDGGGNSGIVLNTTGSSGGLKVKGNAGSCTSAATCTGGAIQNKTVNGISLDSTSQTSLTRMFINNNDGSGIGGSTAADLSIDNSYLTNNSDTATGTEAAIRFTSLTGTNSISSTTILNSSEDEIRITPSSGTFTLNITGSAIGPNNAATGGNLISLIGTNTAQWTLNVTGGTFTGARASAILSNISNTGKANVSVDGATFTNNGKGISIGSSQSADSDFEVINNTLTGSISNAIEVLSSADATTTSVTRGIIDNNDVGNGTVDSGSRNLYGIAVDLRNNADTILKISNNDVKNSDLDAIWVTSADFAPGDGGGAQFDLTLINNVGGLPDDNSVAPVGQSYGMLVDLRHTTSNCANISGNNGTGKVVEDLRVRQRDTAIAKLERLSDGDGTPNELINSTATVEADLNTDNPSSSPTDATLVLGFTEAANGACRTWAGF